MGKILGMGGVLLLGAAYALLAGIVNHHVEKPYMVG